MLSTKLGVGDSRWHFLQAGNPSKPAIVLLHGWAMDAYAYERLGELLAKDFKVIIPDLPGFGQSSGMRKISLEELLFGWRVFSKSSRSTQLF